MKRKLLLLALLVSGCASLGTIEKGFDAVNYDDGITAVEAKRIAQKFMAGHPDSGKYGISAPEVDQGIFRSFPEWKDKAWVIAFPGKSMNPLSPYCGRMFVVGVDQKTGNIRFYENGYSPGRIPLEMQGYAEEGMSIRRGVRPGAWIFEFDGREWVLDSDSQLGKISVKEYVLQGENVGEWTEMVTDYSEVSGVEKGLDEFMETFKNELSQGCASLVWNSIDDSELDGRIFEWRHAGCQGFPAQHEIKRVVKKGTAFYSLSYVKKGGMLSDGERLVWLNWIRSATLRE